MAALKALAHGKTLSEGIFRLSWLPSTTQQHNSAIAASTLATHGLLGLGAPSAQRGLSTQPSSRLGSMKGAASDPGSAEPGGTTEQAIAGSLSKGFWQSRQEAFNAIPSVPKLLGFAGAIPFLALTPAVTSSLGFPEFVRDVAQGQVAYGALIVSFLGAVHWGIAMNSTLSGSRALLAQRERYIWSVFPALAAWPALLMEPAPGSVCIALLLGICYMSDKAYGKTGSLPAWYMTLRGYLTAVSTLSLLATAAWFLARDYERAKKRMEEDDRRRAAAMPVAPQRGSMRRAAAAPEPAVAAAVAAEAPVAAVAPSQEGSAAVPVKKRGWW